MAAACIVGHSHPHAIHSAHSSHHQLLAALLPANTQIPHLPHHHSPAPTTIGPHLSILHEATRNHIQLALHTPSPISIPAGAQFTISSPTGQQQISIPNPTLSLPSPNPLNFPPPVPSQLAIPPPVQTQQVTSVPPTQVTLASLSVPPPSTTSVPRTSQAAPTKTVTTTSASPVTPISTTALSSSSTPVLPTRPPTHEPSELRTL